MTKEEEKYTTLDIDQCKWWVNYLFSIAKEQACNSGNFEDGEEIQAAQDKIIKVLEHDANLNNRAEQLKTELREILDSYSAPRFIDTSEMDVDKFKAEMSKAQLRAIPSEDKFDKFCQLYESWMDEKKLEVQGEGRGDIIKYVYPSYISIDDVNHLIAIVKKGERP